jgi:predicted SAM-dependent methyltransferase
MNIPASLEITGQAAVEQERLGHLLRNIKALKAAWPSARAPSISMNIDRAIPIPSIQNRVRVQGRFAIELHPGDEGFISNGYFDLLSVINIAEVFGVRLNENTAVMDWGVGCSRMGRHLPTELRANFVGVDVDPVNIEWSRTNMPFGRYETIDPYSRTQFDQKSFDLIYSHSVLTHLCEKDQDHWLAELARICRGTIILSVHGLYSVATIACWAKQPETMWAWMKSGFVNAPTPNPDISDVTDPEYYRDVAHTHAYVREHWSRFVTVVEIIPGGFGRLHDAVVCRPF